MSLASFFENKGESYRHPLLTFLESIPKGNAAVEVVRQDTLIGLKSPKIYLHLIVDGKAQPPTEYAWDDELNVALVAKGIRSNSLENEKTRFAFGLRFGFKRVETRFGDGYFNAVLGEIVHDSGFAENSEVKDVLKDVYTGNPSKSGRSYTDCREMINKVISDRAHELEKSLGYSKPQAMEILAGAMARYLDDRFTVTMRRRLGWTTENLRKK